MTFSRFDGLNGHAPSTIAPSNAGVTEKAIATMAGFTAKKHVVELSMYRTYYYSLLSIVLHPTS
jgi:hypothetical protein